MDTQIIVVFCLCDDMLKSLHHYEDRQCQMSDVEVTTTAIIAMLYFKGNFCLASRYLYEQRYIPNMLSRSRCGCYDRPRNGAAFQLTGV